MKHSKYILLILGIVFLSNIMNAQNGIIEGKILNARNNEPIPFSNIIINGTTIGSTSDLDGKFIFTGIEPGYIKLVASSIGFEKTITEEIYVTNSKRTYIEIRMEETITNLEEVVVKAATFKQKKESPVSLRTIGIKEIEKNPGGNRDISRVIQSFPGVSSTPAFRNDVIVRGGGAGENSFYLDGVEIPNLNHFSTQGASGGPVGIINTDFIREVDFYSGAFPANRGGALSSVIEMRQIEGNKEKWGLKGALGASDLALTANGPISEKSTLIFSVRRSYLQFLFGVIGLPFLPTYNDYQLKYKIRFDEKNELSVISLGALDQFELNKEANDTPEQRYILNYIPVNEQWNYTFGVVYKHYREKSYDTYVFSRNFLNNRSYKYINNDETNENNLLQDYQSDEIENKFRYENTYRNNGYKINYGTGLQYAKYTNQTYQKLFFGNQQIENNYNTFLEVYKWQLFGQISRSYLNNRLALSLGLRTDANDYSKSMKNPINQLSPRFSASYAIAPKFSFNFNTGRYYQLPPYTSLGFKNNLGEYVNKINNLEYIQTDHIVAGLEYLPKNDVKLTVEGFYKHYNQYPYSVKDSISLASKGADFGVYGDEEVLSLAKGRAYGVELFGRHTDLWGFNVILSYTFVRSESKKLNINQYIPTTWDNKHLLNITAIKGFKKNWTFGFKWRFVGGAPYTPYDLETSSLVSAWDTRGRPYLDYSQYNSLRLSSFHQLDVRIDKEFFFDKWSLNFYLDIQNFYNFKAEEAPTYINEDENGNVQTFIDNNGNLRYKLTEIGNASGTVLPTIGVIVEF